MENFSFYNPTKVLFGKDSIYRLKEQLENYGNNILLLYGGGSIKKNGLYEKIMNQLIDKNVVEMGGIMPNPTVEIVREGITLCKENDIDLILGVGGGSVLDSAKMIGIGAKYEGDIWDFFARKSPVPKEMLPVASVVTLAGTGSEANSNYVLTNHMTCEKVGKNGGDACYPKFAICDPEITYTVNAYQTACGAFDTISHVFEHYFALPGEYMPLQEGMQEAIIKTIITELPRVLEDPMNYEARANLMWASQQALFGIADAGKGYGEHMEHKMEHILSAKYNCAHGAGLAVVVPAFRRFMCKHAPSRLYKQFARNVFNIDCSNLTNYEAGMKAIDCLEEFIESVGLPKTLRDIGAESKEDIIFLSKSLVEQGRLDKGTFIGYDELVEMYTDMY